VSGVTVRGPRTSRQPRAAGSSEPGRVGLRALGQGANAKKLPVLQLRPLCPADVGQPLLVHQRAGELGRRNIWGRVESRFPHRPQIPVRSSNWSPRSILGTVILILL
jgi:hypothetical protein